MKRRLLKIWANLLFWLGDIVSKIACKYDNKISYFAFDCYQYLMQQSSVIDEKYNFGIWSKEERCDTCGEIRNHVPNFCSNPFHLTF